jgi:hypothetical protein
MEHSLCGKANSCSEIKVNGSHLLQPEIHCRVSKRACQASTACYGDSFTLWRRSVLPVRYELDCKHCYK